MVFRTGQESALSKQSKRSEGLQTWYEETAQAALANEREQEEARQKAVEEEAKKKAEEEEKRKYEEEVARKKAEFAAKQKAEERKKDAAAFLEEEPVCRGLLTLHGLPHTNTFESAHMFHLR
jgi:hypothetical protein